MSAASQILMWIYQIILDMNFIALYFVKSCQIVTYFSWFFFLENFWGKVDT